MKARLIAALVFIGSFLHGAIVFDKTTFIPVPNFRPTSPEITSMKTDHYFLCKDHRKSFTAFVIGGISANPQDIAQYFLPFQKSTLLAGELGSTAVQSQEADVIANYFGVLTSSLYTLGEPAEPKLSQYTFESKLAFKPQQLFAGVCFTYHQHLSPYDDKGWWFEIVLPIKWVKTQMNMVEEIIVKGGPDGDDPEVPEGFVGNMTEAFQQRSWNFGKIDGAQTKVGIADIQLELGYTYLNQESCRLSSYWGVYIPTSNKPKSEFIFEPLVGNCGHPGLFSGASTAFRIWRNCEQAIYWELDTAGTLLLSNTQIRSFDLKDKSWSRYMWVYLDSKTTDTHPGINVFTQEVRVTPGTWRDLNIAFAYEQPNLRAEAGYHFFSRQAENVCLTCPWEEGPAIASIINNDNEFINKGVSRNRATINDYQGVRNDNIPGTDTQTYKPIRECDLDLTTAAHPATIVHTLYGAISYHWGCCTLPRYVGFGFSYDMISDNSALQQWMIWGRFGITF